MANLVQVPWQTECWITPDTLALLIAAGNKLGTKLEINGANGAWRSYATQAALYALSKRGGNPASNPDTGQRNHMRGAAFDLIRTDATAQAACRAVGLIRDGVETWHWNNPRWASMPIIPTNPGAATADLNSNPLDSTPEKPKVENGFDMPQNWNVGGTIATVGENFAIVWTNPSSFSYLTNMAAWGPAIDKNMTGDQLTTVVAERNAQGARFAAVGAPVAAVPDGATTDKQEILAAIAAGAADVKAHIPTRLVP